MASVVVDKTAQLVVGLTFTIVGLGLLFHYHDVEVGVAATRMMDQLHAHSLCAALLLCAVIGARLASRPRSSSLVTANAVEGETAGTTAPRPTCFCFGGDIWLEGPSLSLFPVRGVVLALLLAQLLCVPSPEIFPFVAPEYMPLLTSTQRVEVKR